MAAERRIKEYEVFEGKHAGRRNALPKKKHVPAGNCR
jgi:hypothetical protein